MTPRGFWRGLYVSYILPMTNFDLFLFACNFFRNDVYLSYEHRLKEARRLYDLLTSRLGRTYLYQDR